MKRTRRISLLLCSIICFSFLGIAFSTIFTKAKADDLSDKHYYELELSDLHKQTVRQSYSTDPANITVLTHGFGSGASSWSNDSAQYDDNQEEELNFMYNENSIIENIRNKLSDPHDLILFTMQVSDTAIDGFDEEPRQLSQAGSAVLGKESIEGVQKTSATRLGGIYNTLSQCKFNDNRGLVIYRYTYDDSVKTNPKYKKPKTPLSQEDSLFLETDVGKHIVIVFNSVSPFENNEIVYSELEYILDSVSREYELVVGELPTYNLIAHSRGGLINMQYALAHPNNVASMFSMGTPYFGVNFGEDFFLEEVAGLGEGNYYKNGETGYFPGVIDILNEDLSKSYSDCWNDNAADYSHIEFTPIGSYVTLGYILQALIDYKVDNAFARTALQSVSATLEVITGIFTLFTPSWLRTRLINSAIDITKDIIKEFISIESPWIEIVSGIRTAPVLYDHLGMSFSTSLVYEDDLFIDLDSQLAKRYNGSNVTRKVRLMDTIDFLTCNNRLAQPESPKVAHNLETMNPHIVEHIVNNMGIGTVSSDARYSVEEVGDNCYITKLLNPIVAIQNGTLEIPSEINGKTVIGIKSLTGDETVSDNLTISDNLGLTNVIIPSSVQVISEYAFCGLSALQTVTFASGSQLESIGYGAFAGCTSLTNCVLPSSVTSLGTGAFVGCSSLSNFTVNANLENIGDACFVGTAISAFAVSSANTKYFVNDGVLFDGDQDSLKVYPNAKQSTSFTVPSGIRGISNSAFLGNEHLTSINLSGVKSILSSAFIGCENLITITGDFNVDYAFPSAFDGTPWYSTNSQLDFFKIGKVLFKYNGNAEELDLREYKRIEYFAFVEKVENESDEGAEQQYTQNTIIKTIKLGDCLSYISSKVFYNCSSLTKIYIYSEELESISEHAFDGLNENLEIYVKQSLVDEYNEKFDSVDLFYPISTTINFYSNGEKVHEETAYWEELFSLTYEPDFEPGENFYGWYTDESFENQFFTGNFSATDDSLNLYAKINDCDYYTLTLYYIIDDSQEMSTYYYSENHEIELETPITFGYEFLGWYKDREYTMPVEDSDLVNCYGDLEFFAKWKKTSIELYSPVGGVDGGEYHANALDVTNIIQRLSHFNAKFLGWYEDYGGTGRQITDENGIVIDYNLPDKLYAKWQEYTITYCYPDSDVQPVDNPTTYSYYDGEILLIGPTIDNYRFAGWKMGTSKYLTLNTSICSDLVLEATFIREWQIIFDCVGGSNCSTIRVIDGETFTLPISEKVGYHLLWEYDGQTYTKGQNLIFTSDPSILDWTVEIVADWTAHNDYTGSVIYDRSIILNDIYAHKICCQECHYEDLEAHNYKAVGNQYKCTICKFTTKFIPVIHTVGGEEIVVFITTDGQILERIDEDDEEDEEIA